MSPDLHTHTMAWMPPYTHYLVIIINLKRDKMFWEDTWSCLDVTYIEFFLVLCSSRLAVSLLCLLYSLWRLCRPHSSVSINEYSVLKTVTSYIQLWLIRWLYCSRKGADGAALLGSFSSAPVSSLTASCSSTIDFWAHSPSPKHSFHFSKTPVSFYCMDQWFLDTSRVRSGHQGCSWCPDPPSRSTRN